MQMNLCSIYLVFKFVKFEFLDYEKVSVFLRFKTELII